MQAISLQSQFNLIYNVHVFITFNDMGSDPHQDQGDFVLLYLENKIKHLNKILDNGFRMEYIGSPMTLHPGGNNVEPCRSLCPSRYSA